MPRLFPSADLTHQLHQGLGRVRRPACCALLALSCLPHTALADSWTGIDKQQHFTGSAAMAAVMAQATQDRAFGFWSSVAVGAAKEVADHYRRGGDPSVRDFMVDMAGAYLGAYNSGWTIHKNGATTTVAFSWRF